MRNAGKLIEQLFHDYSGGAPEPQPAWLSGACLGDRDFEQEVLRLLGGMEKTLYRTAQLSRAAPP
jgi:hypothetical protein